MALVIPSIFSAIDKVSAPVQKMTASVNRFIGVSESGVARSERWFRKLTPAISETGKQLLSFASSAAIAAGILATITFSTTQVMAYEDAVASFRTIVSDLTNQEFADYRKQIIAVAKDTKSSSVEVAASFEKIAGLNADFAKTADGIGMVSKAAIVLSKASRDDLETSAGNLVGIMNQFKLQADQANRAINVLAAGQAVGAASITQTAESFVNFGSVASGANITLEQSVGLIQTLGKFSVFGAEAGTKLRGSILKLQQAGVGYKSGQFQINDALEEARRKIERLHGAKAKDAALTKMFGAENISTGRILLSNIDIFRRYTEGVTGTSEAQKAAEINSSTLSAKVEQLKNKWTNMITGSDDAGKSLELVKKIIVLLTDNMETIVSVGTKVLIFFAAWKAAIILSKVALIGYNIVLGVSMALQGKSAFTVMGSTVAYGAYRAAVVTATAVQWAWNAALLANPIGLIIAAIAATIALIVIVVQKWDSWGAALAVFMGPLGLVISMVQAFRRNWDMVAQAFKTDGILGGIKAIGKTLLDAILMPLQQILQIASNLPGKMGNWAQQGADNIEKFRRNMGVNMDAEDEADRKANPAINPKTSQNDAIVQKMFDVTQRQQAEITIKDQTGKAEVSKNTGGIPIKLTPTIGQFGRS